VRASQEGLQSFLFKPFKATQLVDEVTRALSPPESERTDLVHTPDEK
jgi:FixJ family two-component response regulator